MGPGCLCGIDLRLFALPGHGGICFPTPATRLAAPAPHFLTGVGSCSSSQMHKSDCKSQCGKGGPTCPTLPFLPFHQDFSLANTVLLPAVICHQLQAPARRCSPWVAEDALGHHRVKLQPCSHLAKQGDTMPTLMRRGHHVHTVLTCSFFTGCGGNAVSVQCFQGHASG